MVLIQEDRDSGTYKGISQTLDKQDFPEYPIIFVHPHLEMIASYNSPYHTVLQFIVYITETFSFFSLFLSQDTVLVIFVKIAFFVTSNLLDFPTMLIP